MVALLSKFILHKKQYSNFETNTYINNY